MAIATVTSWGSVTDDSSIGNHAWSSTSNARTDDGTFATVSMADLEISHYLKATNPTFDSVIPANAVIDYFLIQVKCKANHQSQGTQAIFADGLKLVKASAIGGTDICTIATNPIKEWATSSLIQTFKMLVSQDSRSWIQTDIVSSGFGLALAVEANDAGLLGMVASVDFPSLSVGYSLPTANTSNFFMFFN